MKNIFAQLAFAAFVCLFPHQEMTAQNRFVVMELNCENLFDTKHDSLKNDNEFLPGAIRGWSPRRYWKKAPKSSAKSGLQILRYRIA